MRFIFRADASFSTGSGHVARLLAVGEEALSRGIECIFVGNIAEPIWLTQKLENLKIKLVPVQEAEQFEVEKTDVLFIDSYSHDSFIPFIASKNWARTVLLADSSTPTFNSDLVFFIEDLPVPYRFKSSNVYNGLKYFPLKKSNPWKKPVSQRVQKIVVVGGGTDPFNFGGALALTLHQVMGFKSAVFFSNGAQEIQNLDSRYKVLDFGEGLDRELESADLVISTASTVALETLAKGLPLGISCAVENQRTFYDYLISKRAATPIGQRNPGLDWEVNILNIEKLIRDEVLRNTMVENGNSIIDYYGSTRIIDTLLHDLAR